MRIPFKIESDQIKRLTTNWYRLQFYKRNPFKKLSSNFTWEILLKNLLIFSEGANFTKEIPLIFFSEKNHPQNFPKFQPQNWQVRHHFFKNSLHEGVFENSLKFHRFSAKGWILQKKSLKKFLEKNKSTLKFCLKNTL